MKLKIKARDKSASWHGEKVFTLSVYFETLNSETRDRVWTAIEKAEGQEKQTLLIVPGLRKGPLIYYLKGRLWEQ